jgi:hypothetical protein
LLRGKNYKKKKRKRKKRKGKGPRCGDDIRKRSLYGNENAGMEPL